MAQNWDQIGRDFSQKYTGTFIRAKIDDKWEVVFVQEVVPGSPPTLILKNSKFGEIKLNYDTNFELSFEFPKLGYFLHERRAVIFMRHYLRQFRKGIHTHTANFSCPYAMFSLRCGASLNEDLVKSSFEPRSSLSLKAAFQKIKDENLLSVPITDEMALGIHPFKDTLLLWYLSTPIAEYIPVDDRLFLREKVFTQEVTDYFRNVEDQNVQIV